MNRVKEFLEAKGIKISLNPSNQQFFAGWEIKSIVDNPSAIFELYTSFPLTDIQSLDDYYLFFISRKIHSSSSAIPSLIHEEHKKIISDVIELTRKQLEGIQNGMVIRYINAHIADIFESDESREYLSVTIDFIAEFCNGFSVQTFEYIADKYGYLLLERYDKFENMFEKNPHLLELVIKTGNLSEIDSLRFETVMNVWSHICSRKKSSIKCIIEKRYKTLYSDMLALADTANLENVMLIERKTSSFYAFLQRVQSPLANEFARVDKRIQSLLVKSMVENGQVYSYEIPVKKIVENWKATKDWELRLLSITHSRKRDNGSAEMKSRLSEDNRIPSVFLDILRTNVPTDDFFTLSRQQGLSVLSQIQSATIIGILSDSESLMDFLGQITSAMAFVSEKINGEESLKQDTNYLINQIKSVADNREQLQVVNLLCYGAAMYTLALAEKVLRLFYTAIVKNDMYVPTNKATFGELLNEGNTHIVDVFGLNHVRCLSFFLIQTTNSRIGHNIRNSLAHWNNYTPNNMNIHFFAQCLWLYTDVLNTIFWYYLKSEIGK